MSKARPEGRILLALAIRLLLSTPVQLTPFAIIPAPLYVFLVCQTGSALLLLAPLLLQLALLLLPPVRLALPLLIRPTVTRPTVRNPTRINE